MVELGTESDSWRDHNPPKNYIAHDAEFVNGNAYYELTPQPSLLILLRRIFSFMRITMSTVSPMAVQIPMNIKNGPLVE